MLTIDLLEQPREATFDGECYLAANPDVARAADSSDNRLAFAARHFAQSGQSEGRLQFASAGLREISSTRRVKLARLKARDPDLFETVGLHHFQVAQHQMTTLLPRQEPALPLSIDAISANPYDAATEALFDDTPEGMFLDLGAGLRPIYRSNVLNVEVCAYPSTDLLSFAGRLPFASAVFDGAVCLSVLEHVPDPFLAAAELMRVVRPGGAVIVDWPFLQPVHGYPSHYFNATPEGASDAFSRLSDVADIRATTPDHLHPIFTLRWFLEVWRSGLEGAALNQFESLTVKSVLGLSPQEHLQVSDWAAKLPESIERTISAGTRLVVIRK